MQTKATALTRPQPLNRCRQTTIAALIAESLAALELAESSEGIAATRDYIRAQNVVRACNGDLTAAYALLGYWADGAAK